MQIIHYIQQWWAHQSMLELAGVITGLFCVALAAMNNIWNWPIAIISVVIYIFIFSDAHLYADMGLQVYFLFTNIYGWYFWGKHPVVEVKAPVKLITKKQLLIAAAIILVTTPVLGYVLISFASILNYNPPAYPYLDSFCTACSLVAQFFLAKKILENWLIWIFVDLIYVGIYVFKGLDATAFMYAIYIPIALYGYFDWQNDYEKQTGIK